MTDSSIIRLISFLLKTGTLSTQGNMTSFDSHPALLRGTGPELSRNSDEIILKRFFPSDLDIATRIANNVMVASDDSAVQAALSDVLARWSHRHFTNIATFLLLRGKEVLQRIVATPADAQNTTELQAISASVILSKASASTLQDDVQTNRLMLLGSFFVHEYAIQSAALFNPSLVSLEPFDRQQQRVVLSLRACGEGHISSIAFRSGVMAPDGFVTLDPLATPRLPLDTGVMTVVNDCDNANSAVSAVFNPILGHEFVIPDVDYNVSFRDSDGEAGSTRVPLDRRVLFPTTPSQSNGIEDVRFVRFDHDGGNSTFYGTFTAYNGKTIMPQMVTTKDFIDYRIARMHGSAVKNKGMALFPRKINGYYWMLGRCDDVRIFIIKSDGNPEGPWNDPVVLIEPKETWEQFKMGNCGSPIEIKGKGWLVLTHGVGPMRRYCIGAAMLDLNDPTRVIGRMREPLIAPIEEEREGYVPNVVYSCGGILSPDQLHVVIPYAKSDSSSLFATIRVAELLKSMNL